MIELATRHVLRVFVAFLALGVATGVVAFLEGYATVPTASSVYLVAVVATAIVAGTLGAVLAALGSALVYDFLFTDPRHTLIVADPIEPMARQGARKVSLVGLSRPELVAAEALAIAQTASVQFSLCGDPASGSVSVVVGPRVG